MHVTIDRRWLWLGDEEMVERVNRQLIGWGNDFCLGPASKSYKAIDYYTTHRLRQWLCNKHQVRNSGNVRFSYAYLYQHLGLVKMSRRTGLLPWAKA